METPNAGSRTERFARCIEVSKKVRWDIEDDVIRGRRFDFSRKFLPDALARIEGFGFATPQEKRLVSQIQGRTYANMFALVERYISTKMLDLARAHAMGDQLACESLVRLTDEELKHQALFRKLEEMMAEDMPAGYAFAPQPNDVAGAVLSKGDWAVLGLTCHIEMFSIEHYRQSIAPDGEDSPLWKDVFLHHMREEAQHAVMDEMEWQRIDAKLTPAERDRGVGELIELIELVGAVDGLLQMQAAADAEYFLRINPRRLSPQEEGQLRAGFLTAYRWQYILTGAQNPRFTALLGGLCTPAQVDRITGALASLMPS